MRRCWARCLGDCSDKLTREHIVTRSVFLGDTVKVEGFPWCEGKVKEIGLANLTAKVLCGGHNHALSDVDTSAAKAFADIRERDRLTNVRQKMKPRLRSPRVFTLNGPMLERWFLKTLINICSAQEYPVGSLSALQGQPSDELVQIAFGSETFRGKAGLYSVVQVGQEVQSSDKLGFMSLIEKQYVAGGLFAFRGFRFLLSGYALDSRSPNI